jgi:hypothetical protein
MTPDSLYAALDEPNADIDLILGQIADWHADHCDERREAASRWMVAHGKRPEERWGWSYQRGSRHQLPLNPMDQHGHMALWFRMGHTASVYFRNAVDTLADQWPDEVAGWWHALRTRGEVPVAGMDSERMVTT